MNQEYTDICSRCRQPCSRLRVSVNNSTPKFVTSCCGVAPVAVRKET